MATSTLQNWQILDPLSVGAASESAAVAVPSEACTMLVSTDVVVAFRITTGGNGIPISTVATGAGHTQIDVSSLRGKNVYFYNATGGGATVNVAFILRKVA